MSEVFFPTEVKLVSIKSLVNAVGGTTEERVEILKNRDKIIRSGTFRQDHTLWYVLTRSYAAVRFDEIIRSGTFRQDHTQRYV